ncbi:MAG: hypothetical protein PHE96_10715 [Methylococcales bacterium]|nr:hypothetical protein [Methylococcales bacterium]
MSENNVNDLKKKIFHVSDDLQMLYGAYEALQVITGDSSAEAVHVCAVLNGLNYRFESLLHNLDALYKNPMNPPAVSPVVSLSGGGQVAADVQDAAA